MAGSCNAELAGRMALLDRSGCRHGADALVLHLPQTSHGKMTPRGITAGWLADLLCVLLPQKIILQSAGKGCAKRGRIAARDSAPGP